MKILASFYLLFFLSYDRGQKIRLLSGQPERVAEAPRDKFSRGSSQITTEESRFRKLKKQSLDNNTRIITTERNFEHPISIYGKLLGADGQPMSIAHAHIASVGSTTLKSVNQSFKVKPNGEFNISLGKTEPITLAFSGFNHKPCFVFLNLINSGTYEINIRLATTRIDFEPEEVAVVGNFNNYDYEKRIKLEKGEAGTYTGYLEPRKGEIKYNLVGVANFLVADKGTKYEYEVPEKFPSSGYVSVVHGSGNKKIPVKVDLNGLPSGNAQPVIEISDARLQKYAKLYQEYLTYSDIYFDSLFKFYKAKKSTRGFTYDWSKELKILLDKLDKEKDSEIRGFYYLSLGFLNRYRAKLDSTIAEKAFLTIQPDSYLWHLDYNSVFSLINASMNFVEKKDNWFQYFGAILEDKKSDPAFKATLMEYLIAMTKINKLPEFEYYYNRLMEEYPNSQNAVTVQRLYPKEKKVEPGKSLPRLEVISIGDGTVISNETLKGKIVLIDFWATWCVPCIGEMPILHSVYKKYKDRGFEILSISIDKLKTSPIAYRNDKWEMPWLNAWVEGEFNSEVTLNFEVAAIPKPILIGRDGVVLDNDPEKLRGEGLEKTLEKYLK